MKKILIVDDEKDIRDTIRALLECASLKLDIPIVIDEADDGGKAVDFISRCPPDLMILDINIPSVSGRALLKMLHLDMQLYFPVITITNDFDNDETVYCDGQDICRTNGNRDKLTYCDANVVILRKPLDTKYIKILFEKFLAVDDL